MKRMNACLLLLLPLLLVGCAGVDPVRYATTTPELRIEEYFLGQSRGWGMVHDRSGEVIRRFTVDLVGSQEGEEFVLREWFVWDDGENEYREWRIRRTGAHTYEGRAGDVVGIAEGEARGNALHWRYQLKVSARGSDWVLCLDDWMFLQPDGVLLNRATMSKFGFRVGEIVIAFQRAGSAEATADQSQDRTE